jgi:iron complex transport system substrate-binding protein
LHEFHQVGIFLEREKKADELIAYWREQLQSVEDKLPAKAQRKKVLYLNGSHTISSEGKGWWGDDFITHAGGINIAEGLKVKGDISSELLLAFDPDVIIIANNKNFRTSPEALLENPMYKSLTAVKNGEVYLSPVGGFWWDRPSPESILGILWLAKVLYPGEMQTIDLKAETRDFFKDFYNYTLQEKAYQSFFARTKDIR